MTCRACDHEHARHINGAWGVYCAACFKEGVLTSLHDCDGPCCIAENEWADHVAWSDRMGFPA